MPEFEENNAQSDPEHSYTPSANASSKKSGRRRSGGFKSETAVSNSKIGEVDPTEVLKVAANKSTPQTEDAEKPPAVDSNKSSKSPEKTSTLKDSTPQPSKATLESIKVVEEKIERRCVESEKNRPAVSDKKPRSNQPRKRSNASGNSGFFAAIGSFFAKLFGGNSGGSSGKSAHKTSESYSSKRRSPQSRGKPSQGGHGAKRDTRQRGRGQKPYRKNASQNS